MKPAIPPTVLIVEDDTHLLFGVVDILEGAGFEVASARDGLDALAKLDTLAIPPSVIVSDIGMPNLDGYGLLDAVRRQPHLIEIPFIFLTAFTEEQQIRRGMIAGVDDYLTKPFTPENLVQAIESKLKRREQLSQARTAQIRKVKRDILTILNHEFRTPLTPVVAYADMLLNDVSSMTVETLPLFVHGIQHGAQRLRKLIEEFILLVELETGEARTEFEARRTDIDNIEELLQTVIAYTNEVAEARQIPCYIEPLPAAFPVFQADPTFLIAALERLVENGIKFTDEPNRPVYLSADYDDLNVYLHVQDQGRGIPPEELESIFETFYQINRERYEDQGAGSGLAIVRGIMSLHSGQVTVESVPGRGSIFTLTIPRSPDD